MKRMTNPVFLETTHFQLSDEQAECLKLEMAEFKESASPATKAFNVRINAIHAGMTKNFHTFPLEELELSVEKWTKPYGKPILKNHDIFEEPLGRIKEANVLRFSDTDGVLSVVASVPDQDAVQKIYDQRYATVSVGVMSSNVSCSVCGQNWFDDDCDCDHTVGRKYVNEDSGDETLCSAIIRDIEPVEVSFVNLPADCSADRYAGVVHIGESEGFEFYADGDEGVIPKSKRKSDKKTDNIALALKESWNEFLSLLNSEGEDESPMKKKDEETLTQDASSVEETLIDAESTRDDSVVPDGEEAVTEETNVSEGPEETDTSDEDSVVTDSNEDITALEGYFATDETEVVESDEPAVEVKESAEEDSRVTGLQNKVQELEADNSTLRASLQAEEDAAGKWAKNVRSIISQHVVDLRLILEKAEGKDMEGLEEFYSKVTVKSMLEELKELRKEFKAKDFSIAVNISNSGILPRETLTEALSPVPVVHDSDSTSEEATPLGELDDNELVESFTKLLSNRRP
jgi:hypothetical protein